MLRGLAVGQAAASEKKGATQKGHAASVWLPKSEVG